MGIPTSGLHVEGRAAKHQSKPAIAKTSPAKAAKPKRKLNEMDEDDEKPSPKRSRPRTSSFSTDSRRELEPTSPLRRSRIVGTASSKLSYLLAKIMMHQAEEKILIFYDGDNAAWYLAQCLELMHIKHLIYAKALSNERRSEYIVAFDEDVSIRVLLMDIRCGALGLNVNKASRVFFINPCCRPSIEAQAIKRAHRIGQNKPVVVETLILSGTIEESIFERSKAMSRTDHIEAKNLEDDSKIANIIKKARPIPLSSSSSLVTQMAPMEPQQIFGRPGRDDGKIKGIDSPESTPKKKRTKSTKKADPNAAPVSSDNTPNTVTAGINPVQPVQPMQQQDQHSLFGCP